MYREQVERIAPETLEGREAELRELAVFCRNEDSRYVWLQGPAWTGKSALLSWFALHPPDGVHVVSFFITARYAGSSDRTAFLNAVLPQLAEVAATGIPAVSAEAEREWCFLRLVKEAARACGRTGDRLALIVDGLDEDRGVTVGPRSRSIAALLPERLPDNLVVITAGRPNPPIPGDVSDGHPLRDRKTIRPLAASKRARVVRQDAESELRQLMYGSDGEQDLLGFVTAAGGGLACQDISELTGWSTFGVRERLRAVSGRTFSHRPAQWSGDDGSEVYLLAHEELQKTAIEWLGPERISSYRDRLHAWAETYHRKGWPRRSPEYLLRGYFRLLHSAGDIARMTALATDWARLDRMLDVSGGDGLALSESTTALEHIRDQAEPDLTSSLHLALVREQLVRRNSWIAPSLPALWARIGDFNRAEALARSIADSQERKSALAELVSALAYAGEFDRAEAVARTITDSNAQASAMVELVSALANAGEFDRAEAIARTITDPFENASALTRLAAAYGHAREFERAEAVAHSLTDPYAEAQAFGAVAEALAEAGEADRARELAIVAGATARALLYHPDGAPVLSRLAAVLGRVGEFERAEAVAHSIPDVKHRLAALSELAGPLIRARRTQHARELAAVVVNTLTAIADRSVQASTLVGLIGVLTRAGDHAGVESICVGISDRHHRAMALIESATASLRTGRPDEGRALAARAQLAALDISDRSARASALTRLTGLFFELGDHEQARAAAALAEQSAGQLSDRDGRAESMIELVGTLARAGSTVKLDELPALVAGIMEDSLEHNVQVAIELIRVFVDAGEFDRAEAFIAGLENAAVRTFLQTRMADALLKCGEPGRAHRLATAAEASARSIGDSVSSASARVFSAALARAGEFDHAQTMIRAIAAPDEREPAEADLAAALARAGEFDRAHAVIRSIAGLPERNSAKTELAAALAQAGCFDRSEAIVDGISDPQGRARARAELVGSLAEAGEFERARRTALAAENVKEQGRALTRLAGVLVQGGRFDSAETVARGIADRYQRAASLAGLGRAFACGGETDRARRLAATARATARTIANPREHASVLSRLAATFAQLEDVGTVREVALAAKATAVTIPGGREQMGAFIELTGVLCDVGEFKLAKSIIDTLAGQGRKALLLMEMADALARLGEHGRARALALAAETFAQSMSNIGERAFAMHRLTGIFVQLGDVARAESIALSIDDPVERASAFSVVFDRLDARSARPRVARLLVHTSATSLLQVVADVSPEALVGNARAFVQAQRPRPKAEHA